MNHSRLKKLSFLGFSLVLVLSGCSSAATKAKQGKNQQRSIPVEVKAATEQDFSQKFTLSGRLQAQQQWDVSPKITGKLIQVNVKAGDQVKAGQVIAKLDDQDLSLQAEKAQTALAAAQAKYEDTAAPPKPETIQQDKNSVQDAQNKYTAAQKNVDYYQAQLNRDQTLYNAGAVTKKTLDDDQKSLDDANTQVSSTLVILNNAQQKLKLDQEGATQATINASQAAVNQSQVDVKQAQINYSNAVITSPTSGIVASVPVNLGATVSNGTVVASIVDISSMKVKTQVSDTQVGLIKQGQDVNIKVAGLNADLKGKIQSISPVADTTKAFPVEITIPNPNLQAKEGMIATVEVPNNPHKALVVPNGSVINQQNKTFVYVVDQGIAKQAVVKVGNSDGVNTEILSGLTSGQEVVVTGQNTLYPDSPVTIMDPSKPQQDNQSKQQSKQQSTKQQEAKN
jgi:HlyD family secretion protein